MNIQKPRGTQDYFAGQFDARRNVEGEFVDFFASKGYKGLETPIFEQRDLYVRTVGDQTDIVQKELFNLEKKSDEIYSLRPEFTAGAIRSLIEMGIKNMPLPIKVFSYGPCFRYERPQKGRKRQFNQLNCELIGKKSAEIDTEIIADMLDFLDSLNLKDLVCGVNCFGNENTRCKFAEALKNYFKGKNGLCETCRRRLSKNPLRILDCKGEKCQEIVKGGPKILDYLLPLEKEDFNKTVDQLRAKWGEKIKIEMNTNLVRGLDYYTGIVFEINKIGDQSRMNSLGGGGRYDNLILKLGGPDYPAIGFGLGLDRIIEALGKN